MLILNPTTHEFNSNDFFLCIMNYLDIVLIVPFIWAGYNGFNKGLVISLAKLIALGIGLWGAVHFNPYGIEWLAKETSIEAKYQPVTSFAIIFVLIVLAVFAIGRILEQFLKLIALSLANKILGLVFGIVKTAIVLGIIVTIFDRYNHQFELITESTTEDSVLYNPIFEIGNKVIPTLENESNSIQDHWNRITKPKAP